MIIGERHDGCRLFFSSESSPSLLYLFEQLHAFWTDLIQSETYFSRVNKYTESQEDRKEDYLTLHNSTFASSCRN